MRSIVVSHFGEPSVLKIKTDVPIPSPGPNQVLVKVHAAGINPVDTYVRAGAAAKLPALPYTPGKDGAGVVTQVGAGVDNVAVGDRVYIVMSSGGTYAEHCVSDKNCVFRLPASVSFAKGACLGVPAFTAYRALFQKARARPGERVFIHGASGGVGYMALQMAVAAGISCVGTAGTAEGIQAVLDAGATAAFNHRDSSYIQQIQEAYPQGFDVCIEMLASTNLDVDLSLMALNGRVVVVGSRGTLEIAPRQIMAKELVVYGVALATATPADYTEMSAYVEAGLLTGTINPIVGLEYILGHAADAHTEVIARSHLPVGNIVLDCLN